MAFSHIVVAFDFSGPALHALRLAVNLARHGKAKLTLIHVIPPHVSALAADVPGWAAFDPALVVRYQGELEAEARHALKRAAAEEVPTDVVVDLVVTTGPAASTLTDDASARGADLICMGTTGRSGLTSLLLGSVAARVLAISPVPVLSTR